MRRLKITYANVVSTLALFIALGGVSYAATSLPHNSVGSLQIRTGAVGTSELRSGAVHLSDIAPSARTSLQGATGPAGPSGPAGTPGAAATSYFTAISGAGQPTRGDATTAAHTSLGSGAYTVGFARSVSGCAYDATLGSSDESTVPAGSVTVRDQDGSVGVQTYDAAGNPADRPFHLTATC